MKASIANISMCVIIASAVVLGGCRKKTNEEPPSPNQSTTPKVSIPEPDGKIIEDAKEAGETVVEKIFSVVEQFNADQGKSIPDITAGAKEMAGENLREMAEKYRDVVAEKEQQLKK